MRVYFLITALLSLLVYTGHRVNRELETRIREVRAPEDVGPLPDGHVLRVISLGFERLVADLFWIRTVNYIGDERVAKAGYPAAASLGELVTDIDPHFKTVYSVMNSVLTTLRHEPDAAIHLLDKGIRFNHWWKLNFLQGFNLFFEKQDFTAAAEQMRLAVEAGGPPYLKLLVARLYASGGDPQTAIAFVRTRLEQETNPRERSRLARRYRDLWIVRDLDAIDRAIAEYRKAHAGPPANVALLVQQGFLEHEPRDPLGNAYEIREGEARSKLEYDNLEVHQMGKKTGGNRE